MDKGDFEKELATLLAKAMDNEVVLEAVCILQTPTGLKSVVSCEKPFALELAANWIKTILLGARPIEESRHTVSLPPCARRRN